MARTRRAGVVAVASSSPTEQHLKQANRRLTDIGVRQLAHAIDGGTRVAIRYQSSSGGVTTRVIDAIERSGPSLRAWCELGSDQRWFTLSGVLTVIAV